MRRIACSCAIALALAACDHTSRDRMFHGRTVGEEANGTTIGMGVGEQVTVALTSPGDSGYSNWTIASTPDSGVVAWTSSEHQAPPSGAGPGNFGTDVFDFEAVAAGSTSVVATAVRPWSGETLTFSVTVTVH